MFVVALIGLLYAVGLFTNYHIHLRIQILVYNRGGRFWKSVARYILTQSPSNLSDHPVIVEVNVVIDGSRLE